MSFKISEDNKPKILPGIITGELRQEREHVLYIKIEQNKIQI